MPYLMCTACNETVHSVDGWSTEWRRCVDCGAHTWFTPAESVDR